MTGASRGIGRAVSLALARRGFEVVATMRAPDAALAEEAVREGVRLRVERLDVREPDTLRMPGGLRVLVNNAGLDGPTLPLEEADLDAWRALFETNVFGLVETTRRALPVLRENGGGVICNLTSAALLFPMPFFAAYRASKAAVSALSESLRAEAGPLGIRVLEILPGPVETDMLAASERPPEAVAYAPYRDLAERAHAARRGLGSTPVAAAAEAIVDAILDDDAPLRCACDPLGAQLLASWRETPDEELQRGMLAGLGADLARRGSR